MSQPQSSVPTSAPFKLLEHIEQGLVALRLGSCEHLTTAYEHAARALLASSSEDEPFDCYAPAVLRAVLRGLGLLRPGIDQELLCLVCRTVRRLRLLLCRFPY